MLWPPPRLGCCVGGLWPWVVWGGQLLPPLGVLSPRAPQLPVALPLQADLPLHPFHSQFRNPKASLRVRLCDLLGHLQRSGERDCREFYRALYIHAQPLHSRLPSRLAPRKCARPPAGGRLCSGSQREEGVFQMQRWLSLSLVGQSVRRRQHVACTAVPCPRAWRTGNPYACVGGGSRLYQPWADCTPFSSRGRSHNCGCPGISAVWVFL